MFFRTHEGPAVLTNDRIKSLTQPPVLTYSLHDSPERLLSNSITVSKIRLWYTNAAKLISLIKLYLVFIYFRSDEKCFNALSIPHKGKLIGQQLCNHVSQLIYGNLV